MSISALVRSLISFYGILVFAYVILSWFRPTGAIYDVYRVLAQVCEPYVGIFRRIVPPVGNFDFSPWVAVLVLQYLIGPVLVTLLRTAGL